MNGKYCNTCQFWSAYSAKDDGKCTRYPPIVVATVSGSRETCWPQTAKYEVCGEWQKQ